MRRFVYEIKKTAFGGILLCVLLALTAANLIYGFFVPASSQTVSNAEHYTALDDAVYGAEIALELIEDKNSERGLYQTAIIKLYTPLLHAPVGEVRGFGTLLRTALPSFCAFVYMLFFVLRDISGEFSAGTLFLSYRKKRLGVGLEKLVLYLLLPFALTVFFTLCLSLGIAVHEGFAGAFAPVGSLLSYLYCPYNVTVAGALLLRFMLAGVAIAFFSLLFAILTVALRRFITALLAAIGVLGVDSILALLVKDHEFSIFKCLGMIPLLTDSSLVRLNGLKCGIFFSQRTLALTFLPLLIAGEAVLYLFCLRRVHIGRTVRSKKEGAATAKSGRKLLRYELKKLLVPRSVLACLLLTAVSVTLLCLQTELPYAAYDAQYKEYLTEMSNMDYEGQVDFTEKELRENTMLAAKANQIKNEFYEGRVSYEEYFDIAQRAGAAELKATVAEELRGKLTALGNFREKGFNATLSYSTGWEKLFATGISPLMLVALVLVTVPFASIDTDSGFALLQTGYDLYRRAERRKNERRKFLIMLFAGIGVAVLFIATETVFFAIALGLPSWDAFAVTIPARFLGHRYIGLYLFRFLSMAIATLLVSSATTVLAKRIKKTIPLLLAILGFAALLWLALGAFSRFG